MNDERSPKQVLADIHSLVTAAAEKFQSARLQDYAAGTEIWVTTMNSVYHFVLLDEPQSGIADRFPSARLAMAEGGRYLPVSCKRRIVGSTFGGSVIRMGQIACGGFLELVVQESGRTLRTSMVQKVVVKPFSASEGAVH